MVQENIEGEKVVILLEIIHLHLWYWLVMLYSFPFHIDLQWYLTWKNRIVLARYHLLSLAQPISRIIDDIHKTVWVEAFSDSSYILVLRFLRLDKHLIKKDHLGKHKKKLNKA